VAKLFDLKLIRNSFSGQGLKKEKPDDGPVLRLIQRMLLRQDSNLQKAVRHSGV
jgi:hypothetical protein